MKKQLFVNLPVKDLQKSIAFFTALGFDFNPKFTDENATCMIIEEDASYAMLLVEPFFQKFTKKAIADAKQSTEVIVSISLENKSGVDAFMEKVVAAGGSEPREAQDMGFMYQRSFEDLDGHAWEVFYMDEADMPTQ